MTPEAAVSLLRDRRAPGGKPLPLGNRNAIDALIATHGVVMNTRQRSLWVSQSPHLLGGFVRFDLKRMLDQDYEPNLKEPREIIAPDPLLGSSEYRRWQAAP
jgi:hypothetical protein